MQTFKTTTSAGEIMWELDFNLRLFRKLKSTAGVDLLQPNSVVTEGSQNTLVTLLHSDLTKLLEVLWQAILPQATAVSVTEDVFLDSLGDADIKLARAEFFREWADFFTRTGMEPTAAILDKSIEALDAAVIQIKGMKADEMIKIGQQALGATSTNSLAPSV